MSIFPVAVLVTNSPNDFSLYAFNVSALNVDEAEGKAGRIVRKNLPGKTYFIKVNKYGQPLDPDSAYIEEINAYSSRK